MKKLLLISIISLLSLQVVAQIKANARRDTVWISRPCEISDYNGDLAVFLNEGVREKDSVRTELYDYLPVYEFANNDAGIFVENVSDSIAKYDDYGSRSLSIYKYNGELFPEMAVLTSQIIDRRRIDRVKGVVINNLKFGDKTIRHGLFLYDDLSDWLKAFGLKKSYKKIPVIINKTTNSVDEMADTKWFTVLFSAASSGMIDIPALHIGTFPVQDYINAWKKRRSGNDVPEEREILNLNRWIREFYR
ncbi:MAG: hypothetical protein K2K84_04365, partial [Muribaculaceae bacterium]|nr:hypothetical protein [Muribaculaceae bacterium]